MTFHWDKTCSGQCHTTWSMFQSQFCLLQLPATNRVAFVLYSDIWMCQVFSGFDYVCTMCILLQGDKFVTLAVTWELQMSQILTGNGCQILNAEFPITMCYACTQSRALAPLNRRISNPCSSSHFFVQIVISDKTKPKWTKPNNPNSNQ